MPSQRKIQTGRQDHSDPEPPSLTPPKQGSKILIFPTQNRKPKLFGRILHFGFWTVMSRFFLRGPLWPGFWILEFRFWTFMWHLKPPWSKIWILNFESWNLDCGFCNLEHILGPTQARNTGHADLGRRILLEHRPGVQKPAAGPLGICQRQNTGRCVLLCFCGLFLPTPDSNTTLCVFRVRFCNLKSLGWGVLTLIEFLRMLGAAERDVPRNFLTCWDTMKLMLSGGMLTFNMP